ncbi:hypothetical protein Tco_0444494 [Tanacetum coccineum]
MGKLTPVLPNSFGIVSLTSPTLSLFPDDPYMKALQAFYTERSSSCDNGNGASNPNGNTNPTGTPAVKTGNYKEYIDVIFLLNGTDGAAECICPGLMGIEDMPIKSPGLK